MNAHLSLLPAGGLDVASSRIRVYQLQRSLDKWGISSTCGMTEGGGACFVQKRVTPEILAWATAAKRSGRRVVYDVDDLGEALWYWAPPPLFAQMLQLAHHVTTSTEDQAAVLSRWYGVTNRISIPNAIDYFPVGPHRLAVARAGPLRVIWFGTGRNFRMLEQYIATLTGSCGATLVAVVERPAMEKLRPRYPQVEFHAWERDGFVDVLGGCDLACLMHDGDAADRAKGNNRMVTAINYGVPALVSRTPEYTRTAVALGVPDALFSDADELREAFARFSTPEARVSYLDRAQQTCWQAYCPDTIARRFMPVLGLVDSHPGCSGTV